jgi:hypothetical protein
MIAVVIALTLAQSTACSSDAAAQMKAATERAAAFDLAGAAQRLQAAVMAGCTDAVLPSIYLRGWIAARDAYRVGGSQESLRPVVQSIAMLQDTVGTYGPPQIAALVLQAAAAAAQSERGEMALMIDYAVQLEDRYLAANLPGLPMVTAHEAAGELWLQVHRYDDARRAYTTAAQRVGSTPRITLGLARIAMRIDALSTACSQYRALVAAWKGTGPEPPELSEARTFLANQVCEGSSARQP